jgi:hypothetical protein
MIPPYVRYWHKTNIAKRDCDVRLREKSGREDWQAERPVLTRWRPGRALAQRVERMLQLN